MHSERIANLCRICLNQSFMYTNIYDMDSRNSNYNYQVFNFLYGLQIREDDGLPEHVCRECISVVHQFHMYKIKALKSERELISLKQKMEMDVASGAVSALEEGQEPSATEQIFIKQEVPDEGEDAMRSVVEEHTILQNEVSIKEELPEEGEGVQDGAMHSESDEIPFLKNQVKDEDITIEEGPSFVEECVFGESSQGERMDEEVNGDMSIARSEVDEGRTRGRGEGGERGFKCHHCGERMENKEQIVAHIQKAHGFGDEEEESVHERRVDNGKKFACSVCDKILPWKHRLVEHMRSHTGEKPYKCSVCELTFTRQHHLKTHMTIHSGDRPYQCSVCDLRFTRKNVLNRHMLTHSGNKPYSCSVCEVRFSQKGSLKTHMRLHTGDKPYSCSLCGLRFSRKDNLNKHMLLHDGNKPYSCSVCELRFSQKSSLIIHVRLHTGDMPYSCLVCGLRFGRKDNLNKHMLVHSEISHANVVCAS